MKTQNSWNIYVAVNFFLFQLIFVFSFVLNSLAYVTIPKNNGKIKRNRNKKNNHNMQVKKETEPGQPFFVEEKTNLRNSNLQIWTTRPNTSSYYFNPSPVEKVKEGSEPAFS